MIHHEMDGYRAVLRRNLTGQFIEAFVDMPAVLVNGALQTKKS